MDIDSVRMTRDRYSAAENRLTPREHRVKIHACTTIEELVFNVYGQLKSLEPAYHCSTWAITSKRPLAVISEQWDSPRVLLRTVRRFEDMLMATGRTAHLHFCLYQSQDPEALYRTLDQLSFPYLRDS